MPVALPTYTVTPLLGRCQGTHRGKDSVNGNCTRQGSLREVSGALAYYKVMLCDWCAGRAIADEYKVRTVQSNELL